jgi:hypothetical protein
LKKDLSELTKEMKYFTKKAGSKFSKNIWVGFGIRKKLIPDLGAKKAEVSGSATLEKKTLF